MEMVRRDVLGRPYTKAQLRELRLGQPPANKGKRYPAEILSPAEINRLLDHAAQLRGPTAQRNEVMIATQWRCGLRAAELLALEPRDVDLDTRVMTVRHGKGNKRRVLGIDDELAELLDAWLCWRAQHFPPDTTLFVTLLAGSYTPGRRVQYTTYVDMLKRCARRARIYKRVHTHGLRHTFAVDCLRDELPATVIQKLLGHKSLHHTLVYLDHLMPGEAIDRHRKRRWPNETVRTTLRVLEAIDEDDLVDERVGDDELLRRFAHLTALVADRGLGLAA